MFQSFEVPYDSRIKVTPGFVLGIYYSYSWIIENERTGGVVPYDDSQNPSPHTLSPTHESPTFAEYLEPGSVLLGRISAGDVQHRPALSFSISPEEKGIFFLNYV